MTAPMRRSSVAGPLDTSDLLGLSSPAATLVYAVFVLSTAAFTVGTLGEVNHPWMSLVAMVVVCGAGAALLQPARDPFPAALSAIVLGAVITSSALVFANVPASDSLGRATWHLGANTWLLIFLTIRRRAVLAWAGMAAMSAITLVWGATSGRGVPGAAAMLDTHIAILVVGTMFAISLRRTAQRINAFAARSVEATVQAAATTTSQHIRRQRLSELSQIAVPHLRRIAHGAVLTDADRTAYALAEARLRDGVRGRTLAVPTILEAVQRARLRGVEVTLLDDRSEPLGSAAMQEAITTVTEVLARAAHGSVTVRLLPPGRDMALTVVATDGQRVTRRALDARGRPVIHM